MKDSASHRADFAARLRRGDPLAGLIVKMPCAWLLELSGRCGFDFAVIDTEHGSAEVEALEHHLRAADSVQLPALVRVPTGGRAEVLHALDAGAAGVVAPHVKDARAAEDLVQAAHYPPRGSRGLATSTRAGYHGTVSVPEHLHRSDASTIVIAQIEDAAAVPHAHDIAGNVDIDAVFVGTLDLSMSLGHPGDTSHPTVVEATNHIAQAVEASQSTALCVVASDEQEAISSRERGVQIVVFVASALTEKRLTALAAAISVTATTGADAQRPSRALRLRHLKPTVPRGQSSQ